MLDRIVKIFPRSFSLEKNLLDLISSPYAFIVVDAVYERLAAPNDTAVLYDAVFFVAHNEELLGYLRDLGYKCIVNDYADTDISVIYSKSIEYANIVIQMASEKGFLSHYRKLQRYYGILSNLSVVLSWEDKIVLYAGL
jgi:hypothetical protein